MEPNWRWGSWDMNRYPYGMLVPTDGGLACFATIHHVWHVPPTALTLIGRYCAIAQPDVSPGPAFASTCGQKVMLCEEHGFLHSKPHHLSSCLHTSAVTQCIEDPRNHCFPVKHSLSCCYSSTSPDPLTRQSDTRHFENVSKWHFF